MISIVLEGNAKNFVDGLLKEGILVDTVGSSIIRILPPLTIKKEQIDYAIKLFEKQFKKGFC